MNNIVNKGITMIFSVIYLMLIMNGTITSPNQIAGEVNSWDLQCLAGMMMKENGYCTERCVLLTGAVAINRLNSSKWNGNTIEEVIMAKDGGYWQYASSTRKEFRTVKATPRVQAMAKYLLIYGADLVCPSNIIYQGMNKHQGSGVYWTDGKGEYFCYE